MPTPLGHALAGVTAGFLVSGRRSPKGPGGPPSRLRLGAWRLDRSLLTFAALGVLADIDFLFGVHSAYTHSIGATVVVGLVAMAMSGGGWRYALAVMAAYGTHVLLDWLGSDSVAPLGVMALWPFSAEYFLSDRYWFTSVCREYWLASCWWHNTRGLLHETLVLAPLAAGSLFLARATTRG